MYTIVAVNTTSFCVYTQGHAPTVTNVPHVPTYQITLPTYVGSCVTEYKKTEDSQLRIVKIH